MQIVISMTKAEYDCAVNYDGMEDLYENLKNGVILPKEHGRLIDAYELSRKMYEEAFIKDSDFQRWDSGCWIRYKMFENALNDTATIIEAESEGVRNG